MSMPVIFDIETGPLPTETLRAVCAPFSPPPHPGEFSEKAVKLGNATKPETIAKKIEEARAKHAEAVANYSLDVADLETAYWSKIENEAALSALTGQVLAIGYRGNKIAIDHVDGRSEPELLTKFWTQYATIRKAGRKMIGFCINDFDIPFLFQRSLILGVIAPDCLFSGPQRYLDQTFIDLAKVWSAGKWGSFTKLDLICRAMGIPGKPAGINGGDFARLYADPETRPDAIEYLVNDLNMTWCVAERVGLV